MPADGTPYPNEIPGDTTVAGVDIDALAGFGQAVLDRAGMPRPEQQTMAPEAEKAEVDRWLYTTDLGSDKLTEGTEYNEACKQYKADLQTLDGGSVEDLEDPTAVTVNHVYRNATHTVAMVVPENHQFRWKRRKSVVVVETGAQETEEDKYWERFAATLNAMTERRLEEIQAQQTIEEWAQSGTHFRAAFLKMYYQREYQTDAIGRAREDDDQELLSRVDALLHMLDEGKITEASAEYHELLALQDTLSASQDSVVRQGLVLEEVMLDELKIDPRVRQPSQFYTAEWMRHDVLMSGDELLERMKHLSIRDLMGAKVFTAYNKPITNEQRDSGIERYSDAPTWYRDQYFRVSEIWTRKDRRVRVVVDGVPFFVRNYTPERTLQRFYPFVPLVLNVNKRGFYGKSDTELQEKIQRRMNKKRTQEEDGRYADQPRFIYDTAQLDENEVNDIARLKPWEGKGLNLGGKDIRQAVMLLQSGAFNPLHYGIAADEMELRKMAMLPEQALGVTGNADFATEVQAAQMGLNVSTAFRQRKVANALAVIYDMAAEYLLMNEDPGVVKEELGEMAVWPVIATDADVRRVEDDIAKLRGRAKGMAQLMAAQAGQQPDPQQGEMAAALAEEHIRTSQFGELGRPLSMNDVHRRLEIEVEISLNDSAQSESRLRTLLKIWEIGLSSGLIGDPQVLARIIGREMGEEEHIEELFDPDPNMLIQQAIQAVQEDPNSMSQETLMFLAEALPQLLAALPAPEEQGVENNPPSE